MKRSAKRNKGITLIALVITIIVLLILAGVTIASLSGDNGIIARGVEAKEKSKIGELIDSARLEIAEKQLLKEDSNITEEELKNILVPKYGQIENLESLVSINDAILTTIDNYKIPVKDIYECKIQAVRNPSMFEFDVQNGLIKGIKKEYFEAELNGLANVLKEPVDILVIPNQIGGNQVKSVENIRISNVNKIIVEEGIEELGLQAFSDCYSLKNISLPKSIEHIGKDAFYMCKALKYINIPSEVKKIDSYAFGSCRALQEMIIPKNVNTIGNNVFKDCSALLNVKIEASNIILDDNDYNSSGRQLFWECTNLKSVEMCGNMKYIPFQMFALCENLQNLILPESIEYIDWGAFESCKNLKELNISKNVKSIGKDEDVYGAFHNVNKLERINIDPLNTVYLSKDGVVYSKDGTKLLYYPSGKIDNKFIVGSEIVKIGRYCFGNAFLKDIYFEHENQLPPIDTNMFDTYYMKNVKFHFKNSEVASQFPEGIGEKIVDNNV